MKRAHKLRPGDFKRKILESDISTKEETFAREQLWIDMIRPEEISPNTKTPRYYNLHLKVHHWSQYPERVDTIREKIKYKRQFQITTEETRKKMSETRMGHSSSELQRQRASETHKGKTLSEKTLEALKPFNFQKGQTPHNKGKPMDENLKQRLISIHTGRKHSPEEIEKRRQANIGKTMSEEAKSKISAGNKGKKRTPEQKERISQACKLARQRKALENK